MTFIPKHIFYLKGQEKDDSSNYPSYIDLCWNPYGMHLADFLLFLEGGGRNHLAQKWYLPPNNQHVLALQKSSLYKVAIYNLYGSC